jgi:hypothetical protein
MLIVSDMAKRVNILGNIRAEADKEMLQVAFYETPDYRTLIESADRPIVVGRRGTGKSALCFHLSKYWRRGRATTVIEMVPQEDQVIGIRPLLARFGSKYNQIKAGARIAWKYAILVEIGANLLGYYKLGKVDPDRIIEAHSARWRKLGPSVCHRFRRLLSQSLGACDPPEAIIAGLAQQLQLSQLQDVVAAALNEINNDFVVLVDQLDEGYEPDDVGGALVAGFVHAAIDLNSQLPRFRAYVFLRDNLFRVIAKLDPDYSKNIEGRFLRLHWDEHQLFDLVCARLQVAFKLDLDANRKIWNRCTANELQEKLGFEKCLQLTLYRPRDLLSLLNDAFYVAAKQKRETLILTDVQATAKEISETRYDDLLKEYGHIVPALRPLTAAFGNASPELTYKEAIERLEALFLNRELDAVYQREFAILETAQQGIRTLYSVGFLGTKDLASNAFVFCHDGRNPSREFQVSDKLLIHPCYWMALNVTRDMLNANEAAEIHDEYEVEVYSEAPEIRRRRISQLMGYLDRVPVGDDGAKAFEEWCHSAIKVCFSGPLRNIELHPNGNAPQRRDVVASNQSECGVWRRVLDDYGSRQIVFEVKNRLGIEPDEYRQMLGYLHDDYGKLGFIITRDQRVELYSGPELEWARELWNKHRVLVLKLTGNYLSSLLSKLRSVERILKADPCDQAINKLLDTYTRLYLSGARIAKPAGA